MSKKIIALALVLVLVATVFTACGEKYRVEKIAGNEHAVMTDEEGNVVIDPDKGVQAIVTDKDGEIVTYENKEPQTYWVSIPNYFVADGVLHSSLYSMKAIDGWDMSDYGIMEKKGTEGKCEVHCAAVIEKGYEDASLLDWLLVRDERNAQAKPLYEAEGYKVTVEKTNVTVTNKDLPMVHYKEVIYNPDGSLANYSECLYFQLGSSDKYVIQYSCKDGVGYDEDFDFIGFVDTNFTLV